MNIPCTVQRVMNSESLIDEKQSIFDFINNPIIIQKLFPEIKSTV